MNPIIIALDFQTGQEALAFIDQFPTSQSLFVKVGMELFYREDNQILTQLKVRGCKIFLDLKLHDIPNTVFQSAKILSQLGVDMVTIHAAGGSKMIQAAHDGLVSGAGTKKIPKLLAVTQLTSTSEKVLHEELHIGLTLQESVLSLARLAVSNGADGVICAAPEAPMIHKNIGKDFLCVTPGIRLPGQSHQDQQRVVSPKKAHIFGSDYIVVGCSITQASNKLAAFKRVQASWNE
ncbi:orotidine-5'-phosphate decarboxylase [Pediococcus damnosus]|uniref:orotidine-5'-phosphate decarboxylase n=1 Tax=Pediococcus damnosus TaxID=51663 RepID=UPI003F6B98A4